MDIWSDFRILTKVHKSHYGSSTKKDAMVDILWTAR